MSNAKMQKADYPEERPDHLMIEEYARQRSIFGCILCDKTHRRQDCEPLKNRSKPVDKKKEEDYYSSPLYTYGSYSD